MEHEKHPSAYDEIMPPNPGTNSTLDLNAREPHKGNTSSSDIEYLSEQEEATQPETKNKRQKTEPDTMRAIFDYSVISHMTDQDKIWGLAKSMIAHKDWDTLAKMNPYCACHIKDFRLRNACIL